MKINSARINTTPKELKTERNCSHRQHPTFFGIFVCGPLQSFVVNICTRREDPGTQQSHVTDLCTETANLLKMAAKIKSEKIWVEILRQVKHKQNGGECELKC